MLCGTGGIVESSRAFSMRLAFFQPKYWLTWIGLCVMRGIELLPFSGQRLVRLSLGWLIRRLPLAYVRIARRNIELCLPQLSVIDREKLLNRHCESLGLALCE